MTLRIIMLSLLSWSTISYGQSFYKRNQADSIQHSLTGQEGTIKVKSLLNLAQVYYDFNLDTSIYFANEARLYAQRSHYDWGYYKSIYSQAKVFYHYYPASKIIPILENCAEWFYLNEFYEDGIRCDLLRSDLLSNLKGINAVQELDTQILKRAQKIQSPTLQGLAWYGIKRHKSQIIENGLYTHAMDSAKFYFELTNDSAKLIQISVYDILRYSGTPKGFNMVYSSMQLTKRWGNNKLNRMMNVFALYGHALKKNRDSVNYYYDKSLRMVEERGSAYTKMQVYNFKGIAARLTGDLLESIEYYKKAKDICVAFESNEHLCTALKEMSKVYLSLEQNEEAINCLLEAISYAELQADEYVLNTSKVYLGKVYKSIGEFEKAKELCLDVIPWMNALTKEDVKRKTRGACYFVLGEIYQEQERYDSAMVYYNWAREDYEEHNQLFAFLAQVNVTSVYLDLNEIKNADSCFNRVLTNYSAGYRDSGPPFFLEKGRLNVIKGDYSEGIIALEHYLQEVDETNQFSRDQKKAYLNLYKAYEKTGQFDKALAAHVNYKNIADSLNVGQEIQNVARIQAAYEISIKEEEIANLNKQKKLSQLRLQQQGDQLKLRRSYVLILSFLILFVVLVGYSFFRRFKLKKEREKAVLEADQMKLELENLEAKKQIEIAEVKNTVFANVSHEFRTPLTLIQVPILNYLNQIPEADQHIFKNVLSNTDQLVKMVDELLDLGKMESGHFKLNATTFELQLFFAQIKANFTHLFEAKKVQFKWKIMLPNSTFYADEGRLKVVLNNLLKNAYAHTPEDGEISVQVEEVMFNGHPALQIEIINSGNKIAEQDVPHLFERYYRADEEKYKGNGIGLALCHEIVNLHHGTIKLNHNEDGRVSFKLIIPGTFTKIQFSPEVQQNGIAHTANGEMPANTESNKATILIVEDHQEMRQLLLDLLKDDFNIQMATNGHEGEKLAIEIQPELILSDVMMPVKDGFELLHTLKSNIETSHIPVLLLTARTNAESRLRGFEQDAIDYMEKPFDPTILKARIYNILRQRKHVQKTFSRNPLRTPETIKCPPLDALFLENAQKILEEHFSNGDFTVVKFCSEIGLNRNSVYKKIKAYTGQTTSDYIKNFRLEKSIQLLLGSDEDITTIYLNCGFNSGQAFNKAFKKKYGDTPSEYRKENRSFLDE